MKLVKRENLIATAKEMNEILAPSKPISVKKADATAVIQAQVENLFAMASASDFANNDGDKVFSDAAKAVFKEMGLKVPKTAATKTPPTPKSAADILNKAAAKKAAKEAAKEKRFLRSDAVSMAVKTLCKKGATLKEIMAESDRICVEKGQASNPTATNVNNYMLIGLVHFGVLTLDNNKYKFAKA